MTTLISNTTYCFCTLALGQNYRNLALTLAQDLAQCAPFIQIVILTDRPQAFQHCPNVLAFEHQQQTLGCYHDKQFVLKRSLSLFEACIFVDADMRILAAIPAGLVWQPGITAKIVWTNIVKHNKNEFEIGLMRKVSQKLGLKLEDISFVHECLFVVARDQGKELEFLDQWAKISAYLEMWGHCRGEGSTIGLAAAKVGLSIRRDELLWMWNRQARLGHLYDSSTGFRLPNGAIRSPNAAWVSQSRWNALTLDQRKKWVPLCPDFIVELKSPSDEVEDLRLKMQEYVENGLLLGWLINPEMQRVEVYRGTISIDILNFPTELSADEIMPGFVLNLAGILEFRKQV